jgi:hypothetical protein
VAGRGRRAAQPPGRGGHADVWTPATPLGAGPEEPVRLSRVLDRHCEQVGRDPATLRRAIQVPLPADPDETLRTVETYVRAGFTDVILLLVRGIGPATVPMAEAAVDLLPRLRTLG